MDYKKLRDKLIQRSRRNSSQVAALYDKYLLEIAKEVFGEDSRYTIKTNRPFSFDDYSGLSDKVDSIMDKLSSEIKSVVRAGIVSEFDTSYKETSKLVDEVIGENVPKEVRAAFAANIRSGTAARRYLKSARGKKITASPNIWNGATRGQMESAVEMAILEGKPVQQMAKNIKKFLNEPDVYFRRFRIKTGYDASGKAAYGRKWKRREQRKDGSYYWVDSDPRDFNAGTGVYASSYRNALRYAGTSTNIAYREAEYERWRELDFIRGIEICISHTNHEVSDICDTLAGEYPKWFKWTGWHPNCRCYQKPILVGREQLHEMQDRILEGKSPRLPGSKMKEISALPLQFKTWIKDNKKRMDDAKSRGASPYFIRDNEVLIDSLFGKKVISRYRDFDSLSDTAFSGINIDELESDMENTFIRHGIGDVTEEVSVVNKRRAQITYINDDIEITRTFVEDEYDGGNLVFHSTFKIDASLQGLGLSKDVIRNFYKQYKRAGISKIYVYAALDAGGYTWARYGFKLKGGKEDVIKAINISKLSEVQKGEVMSIIDNFFANRKGDNDYFPMNLIAEKPYGRMALSKSMWHGFIDLRDKEQRELFDRYVRV